MSFLKNVYHVLDHKLLSSPRVVESEALYYELSETLLNWTFFEAREIIHIEKKSISKGYIYKEKNIWSWEQIFTVEGVSSLKRIWFKQVLI